MFVFMHRKMEHAEKKESRIRKSVVSWAQRHCTYKFISKIGDSQSDGIFAKWESADKYVWMKENRRTAERDHEPYGEKARQKGGNSKMGTCIKLVLTLSMPCHSILNLKLEPGSERIHISLSHFCYLCMAITLFLDLCPFTFSLFFDLTHWVQ